MAGVDRSKAQDMGLHTEQLAGRTQQRFFSATEEDIVKDMREFADKNFANQFVDGDAGVSNTESETKLIQEIYQGLSSMERRVEALETILLDRERKGKNGSYQSKQTQVALVR